jgi:hypothetical protein
MKTFNVHFSIHHESFNGYDHYDGEISVGVIARNAESAKKKAFKEINKKGGGYEYRYRYLTQE